jgi:hypothetical protein
VAESRRTKKNEFMEKLKTLIEPTKGDEDED